MINKKSIRLVALLLIILLVVGSLSIGFAAEVVVSPPQIDKTYVEGIKVISFINTNPDVYILEYRINGEADWLTGFSLESLPQGEIKIDVRYPTSNTTTLTIYNENKEVTEIKAALVELSETPVSLTNYRQKELELSSITNLISKIVTFEQREYLESQVALQVENIECFKANSEKLEFEGLLSNKEIDDISDIENIYDDIDRLRSAQLLEELIRIHRESYQYRKESLNYLEQNILGLSEQIEGVEVYKESGDEDYYTIIHMKNSDSISSSELWVQSVPELLYRELGKLNSLDLEIFGSDLDRKLSEHYNSSYFTEGSEGITGLKTYVSSLPTMYELLNFDYKVSLEGSYILLRMYGDFDESEVNCNTSDFQTFLKNDVARKLTLEFNKVVVIKLYDKNGNYLIKESYSISSFTHNLKLLDTLEDDLNSDYDENQDLKFKFNVYSDINTLYLRMTGYFNETNSDWETRDIDKFMDYIDDIKDYAYTTFELPTKIKVLDKSSQILYEDLIMPEINSVDSNNLVDSELEYYLNGTYSYYALGDFYIYYEVTSIVEGELRLTLTVSDWNAKTNAEAEFENWLSAGVDRYLKEKTASSVNYRIEDKNNNYERSYVLDYSLSSKDYELLRDLQDSITMIGGYKVTSIKLDDTDITLYLDEDKIKIDEDKVWDNLSLVGDILDGYYSMSFRIRLYDEDGDFIDSQKYISTGDTSTRLSYIQSKFDIFNITYGGNLELIKNNIDETSSYILNIKTPSSIKIDTTLYYMLLKDYISQKNIGQVKLLEEQKFNALVGDYNLLESSKFNYMLNQNPDVVLNYLTYYKETDKIIIKSFANDNYYVKFDSKTIKLLSNINKDIIYEVIMGDEGLKLTYNLKDILLDTKAKESFLLRLNLRDVRNTNKIKLSKSIELEVYADNKLNYPNSTTLKLELLSTPKVEKALFSYTFETGWIQEHGYNTNVTTLPLYIFNNKPYALLGLESLSNSSKLAFIDIADSPYELDIREMTSKGYINGVGDNQFNPKGYLTRAEFAKVITNIFEGGEKYNPANPMFSDVSSTDWYYGYVNRVAQSGIMQGVGNTMFNPNGKITDEEVISVLARQLGDINYNLSGTYAYQNSASDWSLQLLNKIVGMQLINPLEIKPLSPISREKLMHWLVDYEKEYISEKR